MRPDAIAGCVTWARVERAADTIASIDPAPVNTDRTTRVALVAEVAACDQPAMPIVRYDPATRRAFAPMAVLEPAITCPPSTQTLTRPVELRLPSPGTWTIYAGADASAPSLTIDVASALEPTRFPASWSRTAHAPHRWRTGSGQSGHSRRWRAYSTPWSIASGTNRKKMMSGTPRTIDT